MYSSRLVLVFVLHCLCPYFCLQCIDWKECVRCDTAVPAAPAPAKMELLTPEMKIPSCAKAVRVLA